MFSATSAAVLGLPLFPGVAYTPCPNRTERFTLFFQMFNALHFAAIRSFFEFVREKENVATYVFVCS